MLAVSMTAMMIENGIGTCLSFNNNPSTPITGSFVTTAPCNPIDPKQV